MRQISRTPTVREKPQRVLNSGTDIQTARVLSVVDAKNPQGVPFKHFLEAVRSLLFLVETWSTKRRPPQRPISKGPGLQNFQTFRIANTALTVLLGFASELLSYTRAAHVSHDSYIGGETHSEHTRPFTKNNSQSLATIVAKVPQRDMHFQLSLSPQNCWACCGSLSHTARSCPRTLFLWIPCSCTCLSEENRRSSCPSPVFVNWQLVFPPF